MKKGRIGEKLCPSFDRRFPSVFAGGKRSIMKVHFFFVVLVCSFFFFFFGLGGEKESEEID